MAQEIGNKFRMDFTVRPKYGCDHNSSLRTERRVTYSEKLEEAAKLINSHRMNDVSIRLS